MVEWLREDGVSDCKDVDNNVNLHVDDVDNVTLQVDVVDDDSCESSDDDDQTDSLEVATGGHEDRPNFGSIVVANSREVHFGNNTFYQGPVTIKQYVHPRSLDLQNKSLEYSPESVPIDPQIPTDDCFQESGIRKSHSNKAVSSLVNNDIQEVINRPGFNCLKWRYVACVLAAGVVVVVVVATLVVVLTEASSQDNMQDVSENANSTSRPLSTTHNIVPPIEGLCTMQREDWLGLSSTATPSPETTLQPPIPYVIIIHTVTANCSSSPECKVAVRNTQAYHMGNHGWSDIGYNFLVGGDGCVYVGRGWDTVGSHSYGRNTCSIGIAFIGTFTLQSPPKLQMQAAERLIDEGVKLGKLRSDYRLIGHKQVILTDSPGAALFADLQNLSHFSQTVLKCSQVIMDMDKELLKQNGQQVK